MLVDMPGSLAEKARYHAERADENYQAVMTCERIYDSVRLSENMVRTDKNQVKKISEKFMFTHDTSKPASKLSVGL
jgi:hypothetical protein